MVSHCAAVQIAHCTIFGLSRNSPAHAPRRPARHQGSGRREERTGRHQEVRQPRLYNTDPRTYVTWMISAMVIRPRFVVFDARPGRSYACRADPDHRSPNGKPHGQHTCLPIPFLRQLIRFYGPASRAAGASYLQISLDTLTKEQERFRKTFAGAFTPVGASRPTRSRRARPRHVRQAMAMFSPFGQIRIAGQARRRSKGKPRPLRAVLPPINRRAQGATAAMQAKLEQLARNRS